MPGIPRMASPIDRTYEALVSNAVWPWGVEVLSPGLVQWRQRGFGRHTSSGDRNDGVSVHYDTKARNVVLRTPLID